MPGRDDDNPSPFTPLYSELDRMKRANLHSAIDDVDEIIQMLEQAKAQVAAGEDAHSVSMTMTTLQNPVKARMDGINNSLKEVNKAQKSFGKALDVALPRKEIPMETDALASHQHLINRAIVMHLLREGQFDVASTFLEESEQRSAPNAFSPSHTDMDGDDDMDRDGEDGTEGAGGSNQDTRASQEPLDLQSTLLQNKFAEMYAILSELKKRNLVPAIEWARSNGSRLELRGSNIEFELSKLQYIWLFKGPSVNGLPDDEDNGHSGALRHARRHFARFQARHLREIQQLANAMGYAPNLDDSPYKHIFEIESAFEDVAMCFTRDFCSLLGLSAESPLYIAVTAGAIALPNLIKYTEFLRLRRMEWTTSNELAYETPLPPSMNYHPIFVCPVSRAQSTAEDPPTMLVCGHVISKESLHNIARGAKYKCPYCPSEGNVKDAIQITL